MSDDAVRYVRAWTHPEATRSARALYDAIAERIPTGQMTTGPVTLDELAAAAHQVERTARTNRDFLEGIGEVKVHDGGRGRKTARYEMRQLTTGARPITAAPLPLRADLRAAKPVVRTNSDQRSDLFADVDEQAPKRSDLFADVWQKVGSFCRRCRSEVTKVGNLIRRWRDRTKKQRSRSDLFADVPELLTTARDVQQLITTTTTGAPPAETARPRAAPSPPCRWFGTTHAWCDGRVHVPMAFHLEERRKLERGPGETDTDLDVRQFAIYAWESAQIPASTRILDNTEFDFWKRVLRSAPARSAAPTRAPTGRAPSVGPPRHEGGARMACDHTPRCETRHACIDRTLADGRATRERQTG